jgi:hypothetical protein
MFAARWITVILLIMAILIGYSPQFRESVVDTWQAFRPSVVQFMDRFYAAFRGLIVGDGSNDPMEHPPADPEIHFDRIVT